MDIKKALEETGKAIGPYEDAKCYAKISPDGPLQWFYFEDDKPACDVGFSRIMKDEWQPYHPKEGIRPEDAGELWAFNARLCFTIEKNGEIYRVWQNGHDSPNLLEINLAYCGSTKGIIHNQNGWKRLSPVVEEEDIERIVIEEVKWCKSHGVIFPAADTDEDWEDLIGKRRWKMVLERPKEVAT
jgi:hypothetical protein